MSDKRQKNQLQMVLAFTDEGRSEAPTARREGSESRTAKRTYESPAPAEQVMEEVCDRENRKRALRRVKANQGSPGIDGMTVGEISDYLKQHWPAIREQLLRGTYKPQSVRRVEIAKPDGGVRKLGIPTVLDRCIQQAVMQVLQSRWDRTFSDHSYGFGPQRSAHQAVAKAQQYIAAGHRWVVDLDLEKFFDRVNHDRLMAAIARRVNDKRMLRLIRAFLEQMTKELSDYLRGWRSYFGYCETPSVLHGLDQWIRRRLRSVIWRQWRRRRTGKLQGRGVGFELAVQTALSRHGAWRLANSPALSLAFPLAYFDSLGLPRLFAG